MNIVHFSQWFESLKDIDFLLIAGPCSAESEEQVILTAQQLDKLPQVKIFRAGLWKPRTSPENFQGVGEIGLQWLRRVKELTNLLVTTEVANAKHLEYVLSSNAVDMIWLGARTVTNPFSVQEIADALRGTDIPVLVKNPLHPDLKLWIGAIERLYNAGITKIAAVHRGFYPFQSTKLRNIPMWEVPINLKAKLPELPVINDPSHIAGDVCYLHDIVQKALDLNFEGLMIEVHPTPKTALSDAKQQITPEQFVDLLAKVNFRKQDFNNDFLDRLTFLRSKIDSIDYQIIELLAKRMDIVNEIGTYKNMNNIPIFQVDRWREIRKTRTAFAQKLGLDVEFIQKVLEVIHKEAINQQIKVENK